MKAQIQVMLSVEEYVDEDTDPEEAFDAATDDPEGALAAAADEAVELLGAEDAARLTFSGAAFLECDSANWTHACAHYGITVEGPDDVVERYLAAKSGEDDIPPGPAPV